MVANLFLKKVEDSYHIVSAVNGLTQNVYFYPCHHILHEHCLTTLMLQINLFIVFLKRLLCKSILTTYWNKLFLIALNGFVKNLKQN